MSEDDKPDGWEPIDYTVLPEAHQKAVSDRITHLYSQVKGGERTNKELANMNKALMERLDALENSASEDRASRLESQIEQAFDEGDNKKAATLTAELAQLKSKPATGPAQDPAKSDEPDDKSQKQADEFLSIEDQALLESWAMAKNSDGNLLRPWAMESDPGHQRAERIFRGLTQDPGLMSKGIKAIMTEMDEIMGTVKPQRKQSVANVLTGGSETPPTGKSQKLTPDQQEAAKLMGVSEDDYRKYAGMMEEQKAAGINKFRVSYE